MLGTQEQRTEGMKKQAQELIEQAYNRGYKAGYEACKEPKDALIEKGRKEAWEAAKKIAGDCFSDSKMTKKLFNFHYSYGVFENFSASEAIEKIKSYEEQKKQEEDSEIHVGDEVTYTFYNGISIEPFVVLKISCLDDGGRYYEGLETSDMRWVGGGLDYKKTGRTFPKIAEVLKKMQEGE